MSKKRPIGVIAGCLAVATVAVLVLLTPMACLEPTKQVPMRWDSGSLITNVPAHDLARNIIAFDGHLYGVTNREKHFVIFDVSDIDSPTKKSQVTMTYGGG